MLIFHFFNYKKEMSKKYKQENNMNKDFGNRDILNSKIALTNETTNARENLNQNDDELSLYREEQEEYYSDNFNKGLELDEGTVNFWYANDNTIIEIKQDTEDKNNENSFSNFNNINNIPPFDFPTPDENIILTSNIYPQNEPNKKKIIFSSINKKRGRISKKSENIKGEHTKNSTDNIERRNKVCFYDSTLEGSNERIKIYNQSQNGDGVYPLLKDIDYEIKKQSSKTENLKLLDNTVKDMLCEKISSQFKNFPPDYNKKLIDRIYREGKAKEVISFLNMKVLSLYNRYIEDNKTVGNFKTLAYYIERMREEEENLDNNYLENFISTAKNFEANTREKKARKRKKNKIS